MLKGRLGLETARIPHADRDGLLWLARGNLSVTDGTLRFVTAGFDGVDAGDYAIPVQMVSCVVLQPGTTISHDALRILERQGTGVVAVGEGGVRMYASMPFGPDSSARARRQARAWADEHGGRLQLARRMYAWRLGEVLPMTDIAVLRGIEGARVKETYLRVAQQFGIQWNGRRYDRDNPTAADIPNQAINHAASAVQGAAMLAVAVCGAIPQLGFIHEDSGAAFALDIADLFRDNTTLPIAFGAAREHGPGPESIDRAVRRIAARTLRDNNVVSKMIARIKELLDADDGSGDPQRP